MADVTIPIAFVAGVLSFLSPCILPLTPAYISYLAGSATGKEKPSRGKIFMNALFFVIGFSLVFSILGVALTSFLGALAFDTRQILSVVGGMVIMGFGVYLMLQSLGVSIPFLGSQHRLQPKRFRSNYFSSFVFGVAFAAGWTPCVGAILGGILTLAITQPASAFGLMIAYSLGIGVPFLIAGAFISQFSRFIARFSSFMRYFTMAMAVVLIVLGLLVATGYIGAISLFIPIESLGDSVVSSVQKPEVQVEQAPEPDAVIQNSEKKSFFTLDEKDRMFARAPEIRGISGYINADEGITLKRLQEEGKVVLVDFWTYSCINCQRTTPYLNAWHERYGDAGLVILGVHSPEFEFEKDKENVLDAVDRMGIKYPVVQDNDFETWRAYDNRYWPRKYIVDIDGFIRFDHIGEGAYDQTELVIKDLLAERADRLGLGEDMPSGTASPSDAPSVDFGQIRTPEIYFGYKFLAGRNQLGNFNPIYAEQSSDYIFPSSGWSDNFAYLGGRWRSTADYMQLEGDSGRIGIRYSARSINIVAGGNGTIEVFLDGEKVSGKSGGSDVVEGLVNVDGSKLYNLASLESYGTHEIQLVVTGDVQVYTFTFG